MRTRALNDVPSEALRRRPRGGHSRKGYTVWFFLFCDSGKHRSVSIEHLFRKTVKERLPLNVTLVMHQVDHLCGKSHDLNPACMDQWPNHRDPRSCRGCKQGCFDAKHPGKQEAYEAWAALWAEYVPHIFQICRHLYILWNQKLCIYPNIGTGARPR